MKKLLSFLFLFCFTLTVFSQNVQIKGVVLAGEDNSPLLGVNVAVKGTTIGVITDLDGQFTLSVPLKSTLIISYVGYKSQQVVVSDTKPLRIILTEDSKTLDEVVVVGYGVQKKSVVTASISRVTSEELKTANPSRVEDVLKGKVSGVQITQISGQPGADSHVRIRGIGTINNSNPLYIVDGMAVEGGINYLNPADIQSVEILKDAASAAIYGARAANGVVLVTTKNGSVGKATINYNVSYGWQNPWKKKSVLNAKEYMVIMNESQINDGYAPYYTQDEINAAGKGTDWQEETFYKNAPIQNHQVNVSGGTEKASYFLSLGYYDQAGIVGGNYDKSNYNRWSVRTNGTYNVFEDKSRSFLNNVKVGMNVGYSRSKSTGIETNSEYGSILGSALTFDPTVPVYADEAYCAYNSWHNIQMPLKERMANVFSIPFPPGFQEIG